MPRARLPGLLPAGILVATLAVLSFATATPPQGPGPGSPYITENGSWSFTFEDAGEAPYHCHPHPGMTGKVVVRDGGAESANVTIAGYAFEPAEVVVAPGGVVTWTNLDAEAHTVTFEGEGGHGGHGGGHATPGVALGALLAALAGAAAWSGRRRG